MDFDVAKFLSMLIIYMVVWIFSVSLHEFGHAWTSYKFGDDTAYRLGRVTINPLPHIDPIGTLLLPIIGFIAGFLAMGGGFPLIAWGKPTPVNPLKWRNKDTANVCVSIAGIVINIAIAIVAALIYKVLANQGILHDGQMEGFGQIVKDFIAALVFMNVGLAIFNLLPFPPLDGSKVLQTFLPKSWEPIFEMLENYGFLILMVLLYLGVINLIVLPIRSVVLHFLGF